MSDAASAPPRHTAKQARRFALLRDEHGRLLCPYCGKPAKLVPTAEVYGGRHFGPPGAKRYWCQRCGAHVGCHETGSKPLGNLADAETREARIRAHAMFDRIWKTGDGPRRRRREAAYRWLAERMGIDPAYCHISWMDAPACAEVERICATHAANRGLHNG